MITQKFIKLILYAVGAVFLLGIVNAAAQSAGKISDNGFFNLNGTRRLEANPAADLDQCANGAVGGVPVICSGAAWQNGNLGQSQAHYLEGESVPYRLRFSNLTAGTSYNVTIEWDTTENSGAKHALDCLTSFDRSETAADPCSGVAGCNLLNKNTFAIPPDANFTAGFDGINGTADDIPAMPGDFTLFNGTITEVSAYTLDGTYAGASKTRITIAFTADATNPVLAWGGHISTRMNWGVNNSAIAISGSPYHMRLIDLNGAGGNQDRSLSSAATIFPGEITIIKDARPNTPTVFGFTAAGPGVTSFSLVDDGTNSNIQLFDNLTNFGAPNAVTVTENPLMSIYSLTQINCTEDAQGGGGQHNTTVSIPARTANIILEEGEAVSCTFVNAVPTAATAILSGRVFDTYGSYARDVSVSLTNLATGETLSTRTNSFGMYRFAELPVGEGYIITVRSKRYAFATDTRIVMLMDDLGDQDFTAIPLE